MDGDLTGYVVVLMFLTLAILVIRHKIRKAKDAKRGRDNWRHKIVADYQDGDISFEEMRERLGE